MNRQTLTRIVLFAVLAAAIGGGYLYRDQLNVAALETWVKSAGALGPVLYMALYASATVLFLPGSLLTLAGGALFNHLDYSFCVGHEDGSFAIKHPTPGGGGGSIRARGRWPMRRSSSRRGWCARSWVAASACWCSCC